MIFPQKQNGRGHRVLFTRGIAAPPSKQKFIHLANQTQLSFGKFTSREWIERINAECGD